MASIFDFLTGGSPKPAWSYLGGDAPGGVGKGFGALPAPAPVPTGIAGAVPTLAKGAKALGRVLPGVGTGLAVAGEGVGVANTAADPNATKIDVATRAAEGVGRLGAMGAGAGLGAMVGGLPGAAIGGAAGYFAPNAIYAARDWMRGTSVVPTPAPVSAPTTPLTDQPDYAAGFTPPAASTVAPVLSPVAPMTAADIRGTMRPPSGTGAFVNNSTGAVTNLDTRAVGYGANPPPIQMPEVFSPTPDGSRRRAEQVQAFARTVGSGAGSALTLAGGVGAQKTRTAQDKMALDYALKVPGATKDAAEAAAWNERVKLAGATADPTARSVILGARPGAAPSFGAVPTAMPDPKTGAVPMANNRTGEVTMQIPQQPITIQQAIASAKANKTYKSDAQVRKDMQNKPGYKLVD